MAKLPDFTANLGYANAPAAPNPAVLEASYAAQGKAMEAAGAKRAEQIGALAKLAETGYTFAVEREAAARAQEVVDKLNEPKLGFVGSLAQQASDLKAQAMSELDTQYMGPTQDPVTDQLLADYNSKAREINAAAQQNMLSQQDAQARLASEMKKLIATHPAMAERVRKVFNSYTGRGDWDIRPVETALTAKGKEDAEVERQRRMFEKQAHEMYLIGAGGNLTTTEIYQELVQNTPRAREMNVKLVTHNIRNNANSVMSKGILTEFANASDAEMYAAETTAADTAIAKLKAKGIDILDPNYVPSVNDRDALVAAVQEVSTARMKSLSAAELRLQQRIAENPNLDRDQIATIRKQFADRRSVTATGLTDMLSLLRTASADRNMDLQNHVKAQEALNLFMDNVFGKDFMARMKDPTTRQQMILQNPGNTAVLGIGKYFSEKQSAPETILELQRMMNIGAALTGSSHQVHQATLASASPQDVANVTQLLMSDGARYLGSRKPLEIEHQGSVVVLGKNFVPEHTSFSTLRENVLNKEYEKSLPDAAMREAFKRETLGRIGFFLNPANPQGYAATISSESTTLGVQMTVENGILVPKNMPQMTQANSLSIGALRRATEKANSLLRMQDVLADKTDSATMFLSSSLAGQGREVVAGSAPIPVATPNTVNAMGTTTSNAASGTITTGDVLNPRPMQSRNPLATTGSAPASLTEEQQRRQQAIANDLLPRTHDGYPAVVNSDGSVSTEISITVTDPRLNGGKPTNIPSLWKGKVVPEDEAVKNALASGNTYQSFPTINAAVKAAKAKSAAGGANAPATTSSTTTATPWWRQ
jgi:hypothetical protein